MANTEHLSILAKGTEQWNEWRDAHPDIRPDLSGADLSGRSLSNINLSNAIMPKAVLRRVITHWASLSGAVLDGADFTEAHILESNLDRASLTGCRFEKASLAESDIMEADLTSANFNEAWLRDAYFCKSTLVKAGFLNAHAAEANFDNANLNEAGFTGASLHGSKFRGSDLRGADFTNASLAGADLTAANMTSVRFFGADLYNAVFLDANLEHADLSRARLVKTDLRRANLRGARVYGTAVWDVVLGESDQREMVITPTDISAITVDNLEVAQFIYLLLNNERVHQLIDTMTSKVVLILGRFTDDRKAVLDAIREELRQRDFTPVLFDFNKPTSKDLTGTVELLARMARFIIADLTDPSSIPHELATIVPHLRTTPVLPLRRSGSQEYSMFRDFLGAYSWVLKIHEYQDGPSLISALPEIIAPADRMAETLRSKL